MKRSKNVILLLLALVIIGSTFSVASAGAGGLLPPIEPEPPPCDLYFTEMLPQVESLETAEATAVPQPTDSPADDSIEPGICYGLYIADDRPISA